MDVEKIYKAFESLPTGLSKLHVEMLWTREILNRTNGNRTKASEILGLSVRTVCRYIKYLERQGIEVKQFEISSRKKRGPNKNKGLLKHENRSGIDCQE